MSYTRLTKNGASFACPPSQVDHWAALGWTAEDAATQALEALTVKELRALAEQDDIDLTGASKKADIVALIAASATNENEGGTHG